MDDAALVLACRQGDKAAFAAIYDRYGDKLHDFCHSVLRDRHEAADAMQETFLLASQRMHQLREPDRLRAWLYAIARHESLRRARTRNRVAPSDLEDGMPEMASTAAGPDEIAQRSEVAEAVDAAAAGLAARDRAILDLHLRHGLDGQELADALGVSASHSYVLLSRVRDQVERSLGALLLARFGRQDCTELANVVGEWDGELTPLLRKRVARHADGCEACGERRRSSLSPMALLSAVPLIAAPPGSRDAVLDGIGLIADSQPLPGWQADGFPPAMETPARRRSPWIYTATAAAVLVIIALLWRPGGTERAQLEVAASPTTTTTLTASPADSGPPPGEGPGGPGPTAASSPGGEPAAPGSGGTSVAPTADPVATTTPTTAPGTTPDPGTNDPGNDRRPGPVEPPAEPLTITVAVSPERLKARGCSPSTATVTATVTGSAAVTQVVLHWTSPSGTAGSSVMTKAEGSGYTAVLGPFPAGTGAVSTVKWWVVAADSTGATVQSATISTPVDPCTAGLPLSAG